MFGIERPICQLQLGVPMYYSGNQQMMGQLRGSSREDQPKSGNVPPRERPWSIEMARSRFGPASDGILSIRIEWSAVVQRIGGVGLAARWIAEIGSVSRMMELNRVLSWPAFGRSSAAAPAAAGLRLTFHWGRRATLIEKIPSPCCDAFPKNEGDRWP